MTTYFIALSLPKHIIKQTERLCFGLPNVEWEQIENIHLTLHYLGELEAATVLDIKERLQGFAFPPLNLSLQGVGCFHSKGSRGTLWAGIGETAELLKLKKFVVSLIKEFITTKETPEFIPHITLGRYEKVDARRLGEYLEAQNFFLTPAFQVEALSLMESRKTQSHTTIYTEVARFPLGKR